MHCHVQSSAWLSQPRRLHPCEERDAAGHEIKWQAQEAPARPASSVIVPISALSKASAFGMKSNADQMRIAAWLASATSSQNRRRYMPRDDQRGDQHELESGMRGNPEAPAGDAAAPELNVIAPSWPEWIDYNEFVEVAARACGHQRRHQGVKGWHSNFPAIRIRLLSS
jgi:hypothetical protein